MRAIFGEKSGDVRDASLTTPPGIEGIVVDVKIFCRKGVEKDQRAQQIEAEEIERSRKDLQDQIRIIREEDRKKLIERNARVASRLTEPLISTRKGNADPRQGSLELTRATMAGICHRGSSIRTRDRSPTTGKS